MENNLINFAPKQEETTNQGTTKQEVTTKPTTVEPVSQETTTKPTIIEPIKKNMSELLEALNNLSTNKDLWHLTYMLHADEVFMLKEQTKPNFIRVSVNEICARGTAASILENISTCAAYKKNKYSFYSHSTSFNAEKLASKCSTCTEDIEFCPHKLSAYIEYICKNNGINVDDVYKSILAENYVKKPEFAQFKELNIPKREYDFIDSVCANAAAELIKMKYINISSKSDERILYSYLPICEKTKKSFIQSSMDYYCYKNGKNDSLSISAASRSIDENRNCSDCLFPQCPDKIAAYFLYLSDKYNVDALDLAEFVITKNKIQGVTLRGNYRYYQNLRKLENIPFTEESRNVFGNIIRYIVNKFTNKTSNVPFLPFHIALYTKDEKLADDTVGILKDFLFYYDYYKIDANIPIVEYRFSDSGLDGLIKLIKDTNNVTVIHVKEMGLLSTTTTTQGNKITLQMAQLVNLIEESKDKICLVVSGEKTKLDSALALYSDFYEGILAHHLTISDMSTIKITQTILAELKEKYELEEGFEPELEYYVISKYGESPLKSKAFIESVIQTIIFNHYNKELNTENKLLVKDIPMATNRRSDEEIWKDLNGLTGLESVKTEIKSIEQLLKFQKKIQSLGLKGSERPNMHMVFAGNPGTGKTTVARLIAEILYNVGFIKQNKLIEVSSKDLIGQYIGHTAPKTAAVCESAYDGVLFIDEAYELAVTGDNGTSSFRSECIAELIKQMEDNRDKLIVIFAGYTKELQDLLDSNAGFASRIGRIIEFDDYSTEQLSDMFINLVYKNGLKIDEQAKQKVVETIKEAKSMSNFGNARYIRNLYENTIMEHAKNMVNVDDADILIEIQKEDIRTI